MILKKKKTLTYYIIFSCTDNPTLSNNEWHHISFAWKSNDGKCVLLLDTEDVCDKPVLKDDLEIKGGGGFKLGSDFSHGVFEGEISHVNVFNKVHGPGHHKKLAVMCGRETGDLFPWPAFKFHIVGEVEVVHGRSCEDKQGWRTISCQVLTIPFYCFFLSGWAIASSSFREHKYNN